MKSNRWGIVLACTLVLGLSACGKKGDASKDPEGNCTSRFVNDYNEVKYALDRAASNCRFSRASCNATEVLDACAKFTGVHKPGVTCQANITASSDTIHNSCNKIREAVREDAERASRATPAKVNPNPEPVPRVRSSIGENLPSCNYARVSDATRAEARAKIEAESQRIVSRAKELKLESEQIGNTGLDPAQRARQNAISQELTQLVERMRAVVALEQCLES